MSGLEELLEGAPRWATMRPGHWLDGLRELCREFLNRDSTVVEIGSYAGESTAVFAAACRRVYAIDPWSPTFETQIFDGCGDAGVPASSSPDTIPSMNLVEQIFDARLAPFKNVVKMKAFSNDVVPQFADRSLDLVYIDAIHTYDAVRESIALWQPKLKPQGVMAGHDYARTTWPEVVRAVTEAYGDPDRTYSDTSWAVRLRAA